MAKIAHLTSLHPRHDSRIFARQCRTLAEHGHEVTLVVADGAGAARDDGVRIIDVGALPGRVNRLLRTTRRVLAAARALDADIYHLHDPILMPAGLRLRRLGKKVVFDARDDTPARLLARPLGKLSAPLAAGSFGAWQGYACRRFNGLVAATPSIRDQLLRVNPATVDISNFPLLREFDAPVPWRERAQEVCHVGRLSAARGIRELVKACALLRSPTRLVLAGAFSDPALETEVTAHPGWERVLARGHLDRPGVRRVLGRAVAGLVTVHPAAANLEAQPARMFEYMAAGIPVIASRLPRWREIIEGHGCGVCVDPGDPLAIAAAIDHLVLHPDLARRMGENGRRAVIEKYNWLREARKLIEFYERL